MHGRTVLGRGNAEWYERICHRPEKRFAHVLTGLGHYPDHHHTNHLRSLLRHSSPHALLCYRAALATLLQDEESAPAFLKTCRPLGKENPH